MKNPNAIIQSIWVYLGEYIAATLFYSLSFLIFSPVEISSFIIAISEHLFVKFTYIMLTASIGFYWVFYKESSSDFSTWLLKKNAYDSYSRVFLSTIAIYFLTLIFISVTELTKDPYVAHLTGWFLILASINVFTFFLNINGLMKLKVYFNTKIEKSKEIQNG